MKILLLMLAIIGLTACSDALIASRNLSRAADMFELERRIVFYNGITNEYILTIEGRCAIGADSNRLSVVCKVGHEGYKKHYLGLSDNVTYFSEQLETAAVGVYHYRVIFKPQSIIPNVDFEGSLTD